MAKIDGLFATRDSLAEKRSLANLSIAYQEIVEMFLEKRKSRINFGKDIFAQLVDKVCIKNREQILFILKDGTDVVGITGEVEA